MRLLARARVCARACACERARMCTCIMMPGALGFRIRRAPCFQPAMPDSHTASCIVGTSPAPARRRGTGMAPARARTRTALRAAVRAASGLGLTTPGCPAPLEVLSSVHCASTHSGKGSPHVQAPPRQARSIVVGNDPKMRAVCTWVGLLFVRVHVTTQSLENPSVVGPVHARPRKKKVEARADCFASLLSGLLL